VQEGCSRSRYNALLTEVGGTPEAKLRRQRDRARDKVRHRNRHKVPSLQAVPEHHPHDAVSNARRAFSPASVCSARSVELGVLHFHPESAESKLEVRLNNTAPVSQPRCMVQAWTARCSNQTKKVQRQMIRKTTVKSTSWMVQSNHLSSATVSAQWSTQV
jgi:hypothetical protein